MAYCSTGYFSPVLQPQRTEGNGFLFAARTVYMVFVPAPKPWQGLAQDMAANVLVRASLS